MAASLGYGRLGHPLRGVGPHWSRDIVCINRALGAACRDKSRSEGVPNPLRELGHCGVNGIEKASKSWPSMIHPHICLRAQVCASVVVVIVIDKLSLCERHYPSMLLREGEEWGGG